MMSAKELNKERDIKRERKGERNSKRKRGREREGERESERKRAGAESGKRETARTHDWCISSIMYVSVYGCACDYVCVWCV